MPRGCKDPPRCGLAYHTVKNIRRIYGRIAGNQLQGYVPLFLREPVKNISHGRTGKSKAVLLTTA